MYKWGGITFALGMALIVIEIIIAKKKREGFTRTDSRRIWGLFWLTLFVTGLVMLLVWMSE
ncbi:MAG: hypothetical protein HYY28_02355 [Betaproteobacteria bacterium]|nr:hypothetical protein [Betaproteobacteria bacterium]